MLIDDRLHGGHVVLFYATDDEFAEVAGEFLTEGLHTGDSCLVVADAAHRRTLEAALDRDADLAADALAKRVLFVDAADTLDRFMANGSPIAADFEAVIVDLLGRLPADAPCRVYGEMVGVLWSQGNVAGAIRVEELWNTLADRMMCSLFCGYPTSVDFQLDGVSAICDLHTSMIGSPPLHVGAERSQTFLSSSLSLRAARRFVSATLRSWGCDQIAADAELVASELATNAVSHARSHFSIGLSRHGGQVKIAVGDTDDTPPVPRTLARALPGGQGLRLIESIATRWGHDVDSHGKIVWAEFDCEAGTTTRVPVGS